MRLNKFIAQSGYCSRRKADELIQNAKVFINGEVRTELGYKIDPERDKVEIDGKTLKPAGKNIYMVLHKPAGFTSTKKDPHAKKTVFDLINEGHGLHSVGRLDKDTEGLLLITNDGNFTYRITHPSFQCEKEYEVEIRGNIDEKNIKRIEKGPTINNTRYSPAKISRLERTPEKTLLNITIREGKKRQIREIFQAFGHPVLYLKRIRIGRLHLGNMEKGEYRNLTEKEIRQFL